jgi:hypothetical protein
MRKLAENKINRKRFDRSLLMHVISKSRTTAIILLINQMAQINGLSCCPYVPWVMDVVDLARVRMASASRFFLEPCPEI